MVVELRAFDTCPFQKSIWDPFSGLFATPDPNVKVAPKVAQRERSTHQVPEDGEEDAAGGDVGGDLGGEARPDDHDEGEDAGVEEVEDGELRPHPRRQPRDLRGLGEGEPAAEEEHERPGHPVVNYLPPQQTGRGGGGAQFCDGGEGVRGDATIFLLWSRENSIVMLRPTDWPRAL